MLRAESEFSAITTEYRHFAHFGSAPMQPLIDDKPVLRGFALVVGQSGYQALSLLDNPTRDAAALGNLLDRLGFVVTVAFDQNIRKLRRTLGAFIDDAVEGCADVY